MERDETQTLRLEKYGPMAALVGVVLLVVLLVGMFFTDPATQLHTLEAYLFSFIFWITLALGCYALTLFHHMVRGRWGLPVLRLFEAGGGPVTLLIMGALFLPIVVIIVKGGGVLYEWTDPVLVASDHILHHKARYLNAGWFIVRFALFFAIWIGIASFLRNSTRRQDESFDVREQHKRTNLATGGFVLFFVMVTFAFTDWVMSLEPHWFSTIYPLWFAVGMGLAAVSLVTLVVTLNADKEPYRRVVTPALTRDLGNLMLALTMLWAYTSISQYLIIWSGNLGEFTQYYVRRSEGGWNFIGFVLIVGQFFIPFMLLLSPRMKRVPSSLAKIAAWILLMRLVDVYNIVVPAFHDRVSPLQIGWQEPVALIAIGAIWLAAFASQIKSAPLLPTHDPRLLEEQHHHA
jgi:hypothetical protein